LSYYIQTQTPIFTSFTIQQPTLGSNIDGINAGSISNKGFEAVVTGVPLKEINLGCNSKLF
jgi:hypothetical protein